VSRERLRVREISDQEGNRLLAIIRRSSGPVVTWRRPQMVLLAAQGMDVETTPARGIFDSIRDHGARR
jgi:hypothetical protein